MKVVVVVVVVAVAVIVVVAAAVALVAVDLMMALPFTECAKVEHFTRLQIVLQELLHWTAR